LPTRSEEKTERVRSSAPDAVVLQGTYYVLTGAWAVLHRRSFEAVSGPKTDYWLVRTVGLLAVSIGTALVLGARRERPSPGTVALAVGAGASFTAVDLAYVATRRISPIYLGDALVHGVVAAVAVPIVRLRVRRGMSRLWPIPRRPSSSP
jgi:hypothetical protein